MNISRNWLQTFFDTPLPDAASLAELLTFHSSEIESVIDGEGDTVLDVKVLPDKSAWLLSHRGVAKELSTMLSLPLADPLQQELHLTPDAASLSVVLDTPHVLRYATAVVRGVRVGESPEWLKTRLAAVGQRSINNVVDATNYVMFHIGQPLHAFDAGKLAVQEERCRIGVRQARAGESIVTLTNDRYELTAADMVIIDGVTDVPIGIAGVKGGQRAAVDAHTTDLIIESANFDRVAVRKTSQRHKLRTDASVRYENGVVPELAGYGLAEVVRLICEIAGGTLEGYVDVFPYPRTSHPVSVSLEKLNSVLGVSLTTAEVADIIGRFGYHATCTDSVVTVVPPFERDDLAIPEDLVEEIGRMYGLEHVPSRPLAARPLTEYNKRFFYAEEVRDALLTLGFSEVYTSSFRSRDTVELQNALAADKGCLRSNLRENLDEALSRNVLNKDLLGLAQIAIFEIGTVFDAEGEHVALALGVRAGQAYKAKDDDSLLDAALAAIEGVVGAEHVERTEGIAEIDFDAAIADLPEPAAYAPYKRTEGDATYVPFSPYPHITRDIALWVPTDTTAGEVEGMIRERAGPLMVRLALFDEFKKENRTSYAFRLVFQSHETTLTDAEANAIMDGITAAAGERGWEVR